MIYTPVFLDIQTQADDVILEIISQFLPDDKAAELQAKAELVPEVSRVAILTYSCLSVYDGEIRTSKNDEVTLLRGFEILVGQYSPIVVWNEFALQYLLNRLALTGRKMPRLIDAKPWKGEVFALQNLLMQWRGFAGSQWLNFEATAAAYGMTQPWKPFITSAEAPGLLVDAPQKEIAYSMWRIATLKVLFDALSGILVPDYGLQSQNYAAEIEAAVEHYQA